MVAVRRLDIDDRAAGLAWDQFVSTCPGATFFHRSGWQRIVRRVFRHTTHFLYAERDGSIAGVLPLAHVKSLLFGNALVSLPFTVYGGVASSDDDAARALEQAAESLAVQLRVDHLEMRNIGARHKEWPTQDLYVTFRRQLSSDTEENLRAIPRKQRAMVRKGISNGLTAQADAPIDLFFSLYADNVHRHGTPALPARYFHALKEEFGADVETLVISSPTGSPISGVLSFYFRDEVLPYYAGDRVTARALAANDFKYWELMCRASARGARTFDYGRSKRGTGSFAFKKNWGFEPQPLHYEYRLYRRDKIPENNPLSPKFRLLSRAWRLLPLGVANRLGPHIVRNLG